MWKIHLRAVKHSRIMHANHFSYRTRAARLYTAILNSVGMMKVITPVRRLAWLQNILGMGLGLYHTNPDSVIEGVK